MNKMENEVKIASQDSPLRNKTVIAWVNRQAEIDRERIQITEPKPRRPLVEMLRKS